MQLVCVVWGGGGGGGWDTVNPFNLAFHTLKEVAAI